MPFSFITHISLISRIGYMIFKEEKTMSSKRDIDVFRIFIMDLDWLQAAVGTMVYVPRRGGVYAFGSR